MCQPLLTMKPTVIPCDPKIRYNQDFFHQNGFIATVSVDDQVFF